MQVVIDIPKTFYSDIVNSDNIHLGEFYSNKIVKIIKKGTPLLEGQKRGVTMYQDPISVMMTELQNNIVRDLTEQTDNLVLEEVRRVGVSVDKEELIRALNYDRGQYQKGYFDAMSALDKVKQEIRDEADFAYADFERYKVECLGQDWEDAEDSLPQDDFRYGMLRALEIICEHIGKENE